MTGRDLLGEAVGIVRQTPSAAGATIGRALTAMADAGAAAMKSPPKRCATCAFRSGCMTNMMPATVLSAFDCVIGADDAQFGCHHGMVDGEPVAACGGWLAAMHAPLSDMRVILADLQGALPRLENEPDAVRAEFDEWIDRIDPLGVMDNYERGRLWLREFGGEAHT